MIRMDVGRDFTMTMMQTFLSGNGVMDLLWITFSIQVPENRVGHFRGILENQILLMITRIVFAYIDTIIRLRSTNCTMKAAFCFPTQFAKVYFY